ncbi:AEC family transporter [soil metagenome]
MLKAGSDETLASFVFLIPLPILVFRTVALADFSGGSPWLLWLAYYIAFAIAWVAGTVIVRRLFGRDARSGVVGGLSSAYANSLLLGIPLIISAYGNEGAAAMSLLIALNLPIMMTISAILIEHALVADGVSQGTHTKAIVKSVARSMAVNPVVASIVVGLAWRFTGLPVAGPVGTLANRLADVAGTLALFSVGMNLRRYGVSGNLQPALMVTVVKLLLMPLIVFVLVATVIPLPPVWAKALVIAAACPTGVNAWIVAARFETGQALSSNAIVISTAGAVLSVAVWLHLVEWL